MLLLNLDELNDEVLEYVLKKVIQNNKKEFKNKSNDEKKDHAMELLKGEAILCLLPYVCRFVDKNHGKKLKNSYKRKRAVNYFMWLQEKLEVEEKNQYKEDQVGDLIDVLIKSSRMSFNHNVSLLNVVKDLGSNLVKLCALLVPLVKFYL